MLVLLLLLAPLGTGLMINRYIDQENRSIGISYIFGFLTLLAAFQLLAVPVVFTDPWGFEKIVKIFTVIVTVFTSMGIIQSLHLWRAEGHVFKDKKRVVQGKRIEQIQWFFVFGLIAFQLFMAATHASFDGDDAYYVVQSLITDETGTLYSILPYTGLSTNLEILP